MKKKKTKKYRIKYQNLVVFLLVVYIIYVGVDSFLKQRITNIYILQIITFYQMKK